MKSLLRCFGGCFSYRIYDAYHGAQDRYKELCDDIRGLEITLQRLGNRLATHPSTHPSDKAGGGGQGYNEAKLEEILRLATALLEDLQRKIPAGTVPRGLYRLKWSQNEANAIRARITGISAMIAAFNSSLLLDYVDSSTVAMGETQEKILRTLEDVLISLQSDPKTKLKKRRDSETSTLVEIQTEIQAEIGTDQKGGRTDLWIDLVTEMQKHGISETQIEQHKSMILQWAGRAIAAGILNQPDDEETETETETYWEVISAVYGPRNVTSILQRMIDTHRQHQHNHYLAEKSPKPLQFIIANEAFGGDPFPDHVKAFSMAWRKRIVRRYGRQASTSYSAVQKAFAQESDVVVIDFDQPLVELANNDQKTNGGVEIVIASWHNLDMTQHISSVLQAGQTAIMATDMQLLTHDPSPGYIKFLSVTYTYSSPTDKFQYFQVNFAQEGTELDIPPSLDILYANWGGLDITATLQSKIDPGTQTLTLDTNRVFNIASPDPWPGFRKGIVVVYRYNTTSTGNCDGDGKGMELLVVGEGMGTTVIKPYQNVMHRSRSWRLDLPFPSDEGSKTRILGVIWGLQPVSTTLWSTRKELRDGILDEKRVSCTNKFFGGDGWLNEVKACLVLVQNVETREISALVGREGTVLELVSPW